MSGVSRGPVLELARVALQLARGARGRGPGRAPLEARTATRPGGPAREITSGGRGESGVLDRLARTGYTESDLRVVSVLCVFYQGPPLPRLLHWVLERGVLWFWVRGVRSPAHAHSPALVRGVRSPEPAQPWPS